MAGRPKSVSKRLLISATAETLKLIDEGAKKFGCSKADLIRMILGQWAQLQSVITRRGIDPENIVDYHKCDAGLIVCYDPRIREVIDTWAVMNDITHSEAVLRFTAIGILAVQDIQKDQEIPYFNPDIDKIDRGHAVESRALH